jgi:hypothetical protein
LHEISSCVNNEGNSLSIDRLPHIIWGQSWSWSYGSWIYNYQCNQCLSPLTLRVQNPLRRGILDATLCDKVCQWLATCQWFSPGNLISSTNKTDRYDIIGILLKVALSTLTLTRVLLVKKLHILWLLWLCK